MQGWDAKPLIYHFQGKRVEMFTRSALALALNRRLVTIRDWEQKKLLPHPSFQNYRKWWLYTREQIEALIALAAEEDILDPNKRNPISPRFTLEAKSILNRKP